MLDLLFFVLAGIGSVLGVVFAVSLAVFACQIIWHARGAQRRRDRVNARRRANAPRVPGSDLAVIPAIRTFPLYDVTYGPRKGK